MADGLSGLWVCVAPVRLVLVRGMAAGLSGCWMCVAPVRLVHRRAGVLAGLGGLL